MYQIMLDTNNFYHEYHGHKSNHLETLIQHMRQKYPRKSLIFLAGDSSLDNKFWLSDSMVNAINGYETILRPAQMLPDISYHMNKRSIQKSMPFITVNCAVEESTLGGRQEHLKAQDEVISRNITNDDILIVSVGGNDIALSPSLSTIWNMVVLNYLNSIETIKNGPDHAWGLPYFVEMFRDQLKNYILKVIGDVRPKKILVSVIYYPDMKVTGSWADRTLGLLGYNSDPEKLQEVIRQIFKCAISEIQIDGVDVIPVPMYQVMDGSDTNDYVQRVEPSSQGGEKLAKLFVSMLR